MIRCLENPLKTAQAISRLERLADEAGIFVFVKSDFREFVEVREMVRPDETVSAMFDPACTSDLCDGRRGFWMHGINRDGRTVVLQAARVDMIDSNLANWAMSWMAGLYRLRGDAVEPARWKALMHSAAERISGNVVYHGEFWMAPELRGISTGNMLDVLPRLVLLLAQMKWQPDHVWGVVTEELGTRGIAARMGYAVQQPALLGWQQPPEGASPSETFACCTSEDLEFLVELESARA